MPSQQRARGFADDSRSELANSREKPNLSSNACMNAKGRRNWNANGTKANVVLPSDADAEFPIHEGQSGVCVILLAVLSPIRTPADSSCTD